MTKATNQGTDKIVDSARTLFRQKGFHQTSMTQLSEFSGVSVGQIYRLFKNKEDVITALVRHDIKMLTERLTVIHDAVSSDTISVRDGFKGAVLNAFEHGNDALTFEILAEASRNAVIGAEIGALLNQYRQILRQLILAAECEIKEARLALAEEMLMALLFGLGNRTLSTAPPVHEETAGDAAEMMLAMLHAQAS